VLDEDRAVAMVGQTREYTGRPGTGGRVACVDDLP
jgi:hypothetical protein